MSTKPSAEKIVRDIKRNARKKYSAEEKIRIILEGLRGEESIAGICRREGINPNLYYHWSKDFLEAGRRRLQGDTVREANSQEVTGLRSENSQLKQFSNYPNPFNPTTTFKYKLPKESKVILSVYNIKGQFVETLLNQTQSAGSNSIHWNASEYSSGVYFYQINAGEFNKVQKGFLIK